MAKLWLKKQTNSAVAEKKKAKKDDKLDDGQMKMLNPVGKADADIDNDGDVDKTDDYLNNRREAIRSKMKSKGKKEDAVMHGGKTGAKSEKKEKEVMAVGEDKDNAIKVPSVPRKNAGFDGKIFKKTSVLKYSKGKR